MGTFGVAHGLAAVPEGQRLIKTRWSALPFRAAITLMPGTDIVGSLVRG
jgi:hypothetical protein